MERKSIDDATPEEWTASSRRVMESIATQLGVPAEWTHPDVARHATANATQVAGTHYKGRQHEPWDVIADWGLGFFDGNAVRYLSRWRQKNGVEDLRKARHYIDKLIEMETKK